MNALSQHTRPRDGTEPATAESARGLRLRLALGCAVVFLVLAGLLGWGADNTVSEDTRTVIALMAGICFAFFCAALADAVRLIRRRAREAQPRGRARGEAVDVRPPGPPAAHP